jgi:hypothetical protein
MFCFQALLLCMVVGWTLGSRWDEGLDGNLLGETIAPTEPSYADLDLYPDLSLGSVPLSFVSGSSKRRRIGREGRLEYRAVSLATTFYSVLLWLTLYAIAWLC